MTRQRLVSGTYNRGTPDEAGDLYRERLLGLNRENDALAAENRRLRDLVYAERDDTHARRSQATTWLIVCAAMLMLSGLLHGMQRVGFLLASAIPAIIGVLFATRARRRPNGIE